MLSLSPGFVKHLNVLLDFIHPLLITCLSQRGSSAKKARVAGSILLIPPLLLG